MRRFLAGALAVLTLAGCGLGGGDSAKSTGNAVTGEVKGKVSLQTWALKPKFTSYVQGVIDGFTKAHPGVQVDWLDQPGDGYADTVLSQASSGDLPDVVNLPPEFALPLAKQNLLLDVAGADAKLSSTYVQGGIDAYRFNGLSGAYAYPWYLNTDVNYWNSELLSANGLDPTRPPSNLDELIEQAKTMKTRSGGKVYLMSRKPNLIDLANAGVKILADDGKSFVFNTPQAAALLDRYRDAYAAGLLPRDVLADTYAGNAKLFTSATVAWTTGGGNFIQTLATDNPSLAPKVTATAAFGTAPLYVQGLSVSKKSKNLATAVALAQWVTNADNQAAFAHLTSIFPSTTASANDPFFTKREGTNASDAKVLAFTSLAKAKQLQPAEFNSAMNTVLEQQFALAISGQTTSAKALDETVAKCNQMLKR